MSNTKKDIVSRKVDSEPVPQTSDCPRVYSYRYMWKTVGDDRVKFSYFNGTEADISKYESKLIEALGDSVERIGREYICEVDPLRICRVDTVFDGSNNTVEVSK